MVTTPRFLAPLTRQSQRLWRMKTLHTLLQETPRGVFLALWTLIVALPLAMVMSVAVKSRFELLTNPIGWPRQFHWDNFVIAWNQGNLGTSLINSIVITGVAVGGIVVIGASAAYPLARRPGRFFQGIYMYFVTGVVLPSYIGGTIILYVLWTKLGLIGTQPGMILIYIGGALAFTIFLFVGFLRSVPRELEEAAAIDGAGQFRIFWTIVFPLLRPVTATVIITQSLAIWNDFFTPLIFLPDQDVQTLPRAVYSFTGQYADNWPLIMAAVIIASIPLVVTFLFLQRFFIEGIARGALRG